MSTVEIWKVRRKAGDKPDYFSYSLCRVRVAGDYPVVLTEEQFTMLFPEIDKSSVPEAPKTATLDIKGALIL